MITHEFFEQYSSPAAKRWQTGARETGTTLRPASVGAEKGGDPRAARFRPAEKDP